MVKLTVHVSTNVRKNFSTSTK